jgi:hypothetical protein
LSQNDDLSIDLSQLHRSAFPGSFSCTDAVANPSSASCSKVALLHLINTFEKDTFSTVKKEITKEKPLKKRNKNKNNN